ncbi:MAG: hypothetical protein ACREER_07025 [Alphaproteobacteria bacterium]
MALAIATFDNARGPSAFFKAVGHPLIADRCRDLITEIGRGGPVALFDPDGHAADLVALHPPGNWELSGYYVRRVEDLNRVVLGQPARPVSALGGRPAATVLIATFDAARAHATVTHLMPAGGRVVTLDEVRLPDRMLSNPAHYLDPLNFATNFALFRDGDGMRTRLVTANYWADYGARDALLWLRLFDADGRALATWEEPLGADPRTVVLDSAELRSRFGLGPFAGSLFLHAQRIAGHDTVKYALDVVSEVDGAISATHDANGFPADLYAGVPGPGPGERVRVWLQNSHPLAIPAGAVALAPMGGPAVPWAEEVPAFGTRAIDVGDVLPGLAWPRQIEVHAGRHIVRPRYEVVRQRTRLIAHANVERTDLAPDPGLAELAPVLGRGFLLVAPVLPIGRWRSFALPTPMATGQTALPLVGTVFDATGAAVVRRPLGLLPRDHATLIDVDALLAEAGAALMSGSGHLEMAYDPVAGGPMDGWFHALFRYQARAGVHAADTSFGSHLFNLPVTYGNEPQSYAGAPPGLSTRLFLRLGWDAETVTLCHLIYPASGPWHARSTTTLTLHDQGGHAVARAEIAIPINGSRHVRVDELFSAADLVLASGGWVLVRDATCRLFGYHGLARPGGAFSLDHMFGF